MVNLGAGQKHPFPLYGKPCRWVETRFPINGKPCRGAETSFPIKFTSSLITHYSLPVIKPSDDGNLHYIFRLRNVLIVAQYRPIKNLRQNGIILE